MTYKAFFRVFGMDQILYPEPAEIVGSAASSNVVGQIFYKVKMPWDLAARMVRERNQDMSNMSFRRVGGLKGDKCKRTGEPFEAGFLRPAAIAFRTRRQTVPAEVMEMIRSANALHSKDSTLLFRMEFGDLSPRRNISAFMDLVHRAGLVDPDMYRLTSDLQVERRRLVAARMVALEQVVLEKACRMMDGEALKTTPDRDAEIGCRHWPQHWRLMSDVEFHLPEGGIPGRDEIAIMRIREDAQALIDQARTEIEVMGLDHVLQQGWKVEIPRPDVEAWLRVLAAEQQERGHAARMEL